MANTFIVNPNKIFHLYTSDISLLQKTTVFVFDAFLRNTFITVVVSNKVYDRLVMVVFHNLLPVLRTVPLKVQGFSEKNFVNDL